jgi:hypothetical protein
VEITPNMPTLPELPISPHMPALSTDIPLHHRPLTPPKTPSPPPRVPDYPVLRKPQPAASHARYPNFTPPPYPEAEGDAPRKSDRRKNHLEVEDDGLGAIWSAGEAVWGGDGLKMAEWDAGPGLRKRWVGPMM